MNTRRWCPRRAHSTGHRGVVLLVLLYLSCSGLWYLVLPPLEAPDENAHFDYARYIATHRRLPVVLAPPLWDPSEWIQPPLYYLVISPVLWVFGPDAAWRNPLQLNDSRGLFGQFRAYVFDGQATPAIRALYTVRLLSVLLGLGTVLCAYAAARRVTGSSRQALLAASGLVLVPQFTFLSTVVSNDTLVTLLSAAAVVLLFRLIQDQGGSWMAFAAGLLTGLALATKMNAVCLLPMLIVGVGLQRGTQAAKLRQAAWLAAGVMIGSGWYLTRNWIAFGDPLAWSLRTQAMHPAEAAAQIQVWNDIAARPWYRPYFLTTFPAQVFASFWARFGWADLPVGRPLLVFYAGVTWLAMCGVAACAVNTLRQRACPAHERAIALTCMTGVGAAFLVFVAYNLVRVTPQARLLYPALVPLLVLVALGVQAILRIARTVAGARPIRLAVTALYLWLIAAWFAAWRLAIERFMTW